jgi:hypothetical protein
MPENPENPEQSDKPARPVYAKVEIQAGAQLPIYWTPEMAGIAREHDFNLTLQWLGSLMVAYNHLKHRIYEFLSYYKRGGFSTCRYDHQVYAPSCEKT